MAKLIQYREKCIGCGICEELQPEYWRMSMKDGKATLLHAANKKNILIRPIHQSDFETSTNVANACPVKIIQVR
ncbi:hypothetical protein BCY91_10625 [Pelobium manganitolerans]|uniref:4Fe-4S ferredoxin-type domain-containing protein n=1 Tax=Pelobium manganitolerans TaxID=1842495 RepID=A0A419S2Q2_9SPHI|nr:ferredoxin [Pelobium manganitolerans]RKD13259.1 hypothetical protein BCY91_10625 [Pelobium manganitolerans]